jgi:site-specific DNA-methyltransferase (adenine-specific)
MIRLEAGDCLEVIPRLVVEGVVVDAVVTDPPYGLEFMNVAWDTMRPNGRPRTRNEWGDFGSREHARSTEEAGHVRAKKSRAFEAFTAQWAPLCYEILRPGGYLLAFGGTRTYHRMVCAIEDAGFVIQDQVDWLYGSGWPKGRTQLKPAHDPICMAYKPGGKRELGIDECKIGTDVLPEIKAGQAQLGTFERHDMVTPERSGRWPANVIHDGSDEVMAAFAAYGERKSGSSLSGNEPSSSHSRIWQGGMGRTPFSSHGDIGTAARFFYTAKADKQDRWGSKHPTVKPVDLIRYLVKFVCPPGGAFLDPFAGSGTAALAALAEGRDAILIEQDAGYCADIRERIAHYEGAGRHSLVAKNRAAHDKAGPLI